MNRYTLLFTLLFTATSLLWSQSSSCGSELRYFSPTDLQAFPDLTDRSLSPLPKGGEPDTVALTIHIIETNKANAEHLRQETIEREIAAVNEAFSKAGIHFLACGPIRTIKGESTYTFTTSDQLNRAHHVPNTINLYFADWLQSDDNFPICGFSAFPWLDRPTERYIMMSKPCLDSGITLTHEFGHFYGLYHTHETYFGEEFVDGSNCHSAGDKVCDTSADPNLGLSFISNNCSYQSSHKDSRGDSYMPPISNFMSYAPSLCRNQFSIQQNALIRSIHKKENAYLFRDCSFYPDFTIDFNIGSSITIRSGDPIHTSYSFKNDGINKPYDLDLLFYIAETPEAINTPIHHEIISIRSGEEDLKRNFTIDFPGSRGSGTYYLIAKIDPYDKVVERREQNNAIALTVNIDNAGLDNVRLFPNPVRDELNFFLRNEDLAGLIDIRIFRADGRLVRSLPNISKQDEEVLGRVPVSDLSPGFYLLSLVFQEGKAPQTFRFWKE